MSRSNRGGFCLFFQKRELRGNRILRSQGVLLVREGATESGQE